MRVRSKPIVQLYACVPRLKMYEQRENNNHKWKKNFRRKRTCGWKRERGGKKISQMRMDAI